MMMNYILIPLYCFNTCYVSAFLVPLPSNISSMLFLLLFSFNNVYFGIVIDVSYPLHLFVT